MVALPGVRVGFTATKEGKPLRPGRTSRAGRPVRRQDERDEDAGQNEGGEERFQILSNH